MRNKNEKETAQQKASETEPKENIPELTAQATGDATVNMNQSWSTVKKKRTVHHNPRLLRHERAKETG
jgi:hypothetical protein